jgi:hypothetical protein
MPSTTHDFVPSATYPRHVLALIILVLTTFPAGCTRPNDASTAETTQRADDARDRLTASEGGQLVLQAIEAHGGLDAWHDAPTSSYTWEYANVGADLQFKSFLVADNQTRQVYHDLLTLGAYGEPQPISGRFAWDGTDAWIYPDSITQINPRFWATTGYYFEQIPFVLADPGLRYDVLPDEMLDGDPHTMVCISYDAGVGDSPGDTYTLYLDKETSRVNAIRYTVTYGRDPAPDAPQRQTLFYYDDYVTVDGLTVPTHFRGYTFTDGERGALRNEAWADSISFSRPFDASQLTAPPGARMAPPPNAER